VKIVSVNAWGGALYDDLAAWLRATDADVLCFQEMTRTAGAHGWTRFTDGERHLPQRANLFADVAALLPEHDGYFVASDAGPVTTEDGVRHVQDFGIATFVSKRLILDTVEEGFVHGECVVHREWPTGDRPRAVLATRVIGAHDARGRPATVVQLHGLRDPAGKGDTPARLEQARRLADFVTKVRVEGDVAVVAGDLNLLPDSGTFQILAAAGLTDLVGHADTRTPHYPKPVRHASYLLVSDPEAVGRFAVLDVEVSDHRVLQLVVADRPANV
jgi:endonuclease/exonuclease/phosphatase family metal-dependent hydrolase